METTQVAATFRAAPVAMRPLSTALGAEILGLDLRHELDEHTFAQIRDIWHR